VGWTYAITGDALPAFLALDVRLQEAVLDALDVLCDEPDRLPPDTPFGRFVPIPLERDDGGLDVVIPRLLSDEPRRTLLVVGISHTRT